MNDALADTDPFHLVDWLGSERFGGQTGSKVPVDARLPHDAQQAPPIALPPPQGGRQDQDAFVSEQLPEQLYVSTMIGDACRVLARSGAPRLSVQSVVAQLLAPARLQQMRVLRDPDFRPFAFYTWALVDEPTDSALKRDPGEVLALGDWNSGTQLWIMDLYGVPRRIKEIARDMVKSIPGSHEGLSWRRARQNRDYSVRGTTWDRLAGWAR